METVRIQFDLQDMLCEAMQKKAESIIGNPLDKYEIAQIREIVEKHFIDDTIDYQWEVREEAQRKHKDEINEIIDESIDCCLAVVEAEYGNLISMPRLIGNFIASHAKLLEIMEDPIYQEELDYIYKHYRDNTLDFKSGRFVYKYMKSPRSYDPQKIGLDILERIVKEYEAYWEDVISDMVRRPAIRDRRKYLINQLDEIIANMAEDYPDFAQSLKRYQEFNVDEMEKIKQSMISKN